MIWNNELSPSEPVKIQIQILEMQDPVEKTVEEKVFVTMVGKFFSDFFWFD